MADTTTTNLPVLDFSEVSRTRTFKRQALAPTEKGTITQAVVDKVSVTETSDKSKNPGTLQFVFELKPLDARGKPVQFGVRHFVPIPKDNPARPGHKLTNEERNDGYKKCRDVIRALLGGDAIPAGPRKMDGADAWVDAEGNKLTKEELNAAFGARDAAVDEILKKWYCLDDATGKRGYEDLKGALLYCTLRRNDAGYTNVGYIRNDPGDATVVAAEMIDVE